MAAAQALVGDVTWSPPLQGAPRLAFDRIAAGLAGVRTVQVGLPDASGYAAGRGAWGSAMASLFARYEAGRALNGWRLSLSLAQLLIVALLVADATIIGLRAPSDLVNAANRLFLFRVRPPRGSLRITLRQCCRRRGATRCEDGPRRERQNQQQQNQDRDSAAPALCRPRRGPSGNFFVVGRASARQPVRP